MFDTTQSSFQALIKLLNDSPGDCVFCVGTGVTSAAVSSWQSADAPDPTTWDGLIKNGINQVSKTAPALAQRLSSSEHGNSARATGIKAALGPAGYVTWLTECFRDLRVDPGRDQIHRLLAKALLRGARVLTTNYDTLITDFLDQADIIPITMSSPDLMKRFAIGNESGGERGVLHIHGVYSDPSSIVLTDAEYANAQKDDARRQSLGQLLVSNHLIFLGCGETIRDQNLGASLSWAQNFLGENAKRSFFVGFAENFAELSKTSGGAKSTAFANSAVQPIVVPAGSNSHPDLFGFAAELSAKLGSGPFDRFDAASLTTNIRAVAGDSADEKPSDTEIKNLPAPPCESHVLEEFERRQALHVRGTAAKGKTMLGLRLATANQQSGRQVHWWRINEKTDSEPDWRARLGRLRALLHLDDAFVVIDEAHIEPERIAELIAMAECCARGHLLILSTGPAITGTVNFHTNAAFFAEVANFVAGRFDRNLMPSVEVAEEWHRLFNGRTVNLARALLNKLPGTPANVVPALSTDDVVAWMKERLKDIPERSPAGQILAALTCFADGDEAGSYWAATDQIGVADVGNGALDIVLATGLLAKRTRRDEVQYRLANADHDAQLIKQARCIGQDTVDAFRVSKVRLALLRQPGDGRKLSNPTKGNQREAFLTATERAQLASKFSGWDSQCLRATIGRPPFTSAPLIEWLTTQNPAVARATVARMDDHDAWSAAALASAPSLIGAGKMAAAIWHAGRRNDDPNNSDFDAFADRVATAAIRRANVDRDLWCGSETIDSFAKVFRQSRSALPEERRSFLDIVSGQGQRQLDQWVRGSLPANPRDWNTFYNRFSLGNLLYDLAFYGDTISAHFARERLASFGQDLVKKMEPHFAALPRQGINPANHRESPVQTASAAIQMAGALGVYDRVGDLRQTLSALLPATVAELTRHVAGNRIRHTFEPMPTDFEVPIAQRDTPTADIIGIEQRQQRFWYGLHVWAGVTGKSLILPPDLMEQTRRMICNRRTLAQRDTGPDWPLANKSGIALEGWVASARNGCLRPPEQTIGAITRYWN